MCIFNLLGAFLSSILISHGVHNHHHQAFGFSMFAILVWLCCLSSSDGNLAAVFFMFATTMNGMIGITTYLVPSESFPATLRGTAVGLSAASGKIGAAIGTGTFPLIEASKGLSTVL